MMNSLNVEDKLIQEYSQHTIGALMNNERKSYNVINYSLTSYSSSAIRKQIMTEVGMCTTCYKLTK